VAATRLASTEPRSPAGDKIRVRLQRLAHPFDLRADFPLVAIVIVRHDPQADWPSSDPDKDTRSAPMAPA